MPQLVHRKDRDEGANNETVMLPLLTPPRISADELINAILDLKPLPAMRPRNLFPKEVYITLFPPGYCFPTFVIYRAYTDPIKYLRRFISQYGAMVENDVLLLKQFSLSLGGIAYDWYHTLPGMIISTWTAMEELFLREQSTYWHTPEFLRNVAENEIGRIKDIPWSPIPEEIKTTST